MIDLLACWSAVRLLNADLIHLIISRDDSSAGAVLDVAKSLTLGSLHTKPNTVYTHALSPE